MDDFRRNELDGKIVSHSMDQDPQQFWKIASQFFLKSQPLKRSNGSKLNTHFFSGWDTFSRLKKFPSKTLPFPFKKISLESENGQN
jgi:hypothetical protein